MLTLIIGRANSGKTARIFDTLKTAVKEHSGGRILIVPEQYSHNAERILAQTCGDEACLYVEILSFSRLAVRVFAEVGGMADGLLDNGGRMLAMSLALSETSSQLKQFNVGHRRPDFLRELLTSYDELRMACSGSRDLYRASLEDNGSFSAKLQDLALIFEMYDAIKERSGCDTRDRLARLAESIGESHVGCGGVFIDGFTDFTAQEFRVIEKMLARGTDITVCLTCPNLTSTEALFRMPIRTAHALIDSANRQGEKVNIIMTECQEGSPALRHLERNIMRYDMCEYEGGAHGISVIRAGNTQEECCAAAAKVLELVRRGCRYRDIAVVSSTWDIYEPVIRGVFARYNIPINLTEKSNISEKPVIAMLTGALDIILNNWEYNDVFRYLKTGMAGITCEECDILENYALMWALRGKRAWCSRDWSMNPRGYSDEFTDRDTVLLEQLNNLRAAVTTPIARLDSALEREDGATGKIRAVYTFLDDIGLYGIIEQKRHELHLSGELALADEYRQIWDIMIGAMQQFADILGDMYIETPEFIKLLKLVLSQYQVGTIPASADAVNVGNMQRVRPRGLRHLIVIGASEGALPPSERGGGIFTEQEREKLRVLGVDLPDSEDDVISRQLNSIYASFTLPSETLTVMYPANNDRAFIVTRLLRMFHMRETAADMEIYAAAPEPCFEMSISGSGKLARAAREVFKSRDEYSRRADAVAHAAKLSRGKIDQLTAERLYGKPLNISASQIDRFYSCQFSYFLEYGLRLKPRRTAALDAPEAGTFMHFCLERALRLIDGRGGYEQVTEADVEEMVDAIVTEYVNTHLGGMENKSGRFRYLFTRLVNTVGDIILELCEEMRNSQFRPLEFELRFTDSGTDLFGGGVNIRGVADRIDGWIHGNNLYLRVVDYKTGKKTMNLADVWNGLGLQMLIYLFCLESEGETRYGRNIIPAGVLYMPARDVLINERYDIPDEELHEELRHEIRRSGILLDDKDVLEAMESSEVKAKLLPVKFSRDGHPTGDSLASLEQFRKLSKLVRKLVSEMKRDVSGGSIVCNPYIRGQRDTACLRCDYYDICHFDAYEGDKERWITPMKNDEFWRNVEDLNG